MQFGICLIMLIRQPFTHSVHSSVSSVCFPLLMSAVHELTCAHFPPPKLVYCLLSVHASVHCVRQISKVYSIVSVSPASHFFVSDLSEQLLDAVVRFFCSNGSHSLLSIFRLIISSLLRELNALWLERESSLANSNSAFPTIHSARSLSECTLE